MRPEMTPSVAAAIRGSYTMTSRVEVWRGDTRLDTALPGGELTVFDGEVTLDGTAKVKRQIQIDVPNTDQIWRLLSVPGTELRPYWGIVFPAADPVTSPAPAAGFGTSPFGTGPFGGTSTATGRLGQDALGTAPLGGASGLPAVVDSPTVGGGTVWVPLGRMEVDQPHIDYSPEGNLTVTGGDYYARVQTSDFLVPATAEFGTLITTEIMTLLQQALPDVTVINQMTTPWVIGNRVWQTDRAAALEEMLIAIGAELVFDATGRAIIRPVPSITGTAVWTINAGRPGVLVAADRQGTLANARNVVVVSPTGVDGDPQFDPVIVWDNDPASPTYAGPDPVHNPGGAAAFGVRPFQLSSASIRDPEQARQAGLAQLAKVSGLSSQLNLQAYTNAGLEPGDTIAVQLPPDVVDGARLIEAHLVDKVTIPLVPEGKQQITTRARGAVSA